MDSSYRSRPTGLSWNRRRHSQWNSAPAAHPVRKASSARIAGAWALTAMATVRRRLGSVHRCVCCGVEDDFRCGVANHCAHLIRQGQVDCIAVAANDFTVIGEAALQLDANLSAGANDKDTGRSLKQRPPHRARRRPWLSFAETMASSRPTGHGIPRSGSFHRMVRSPAGQ